METVDELNTAMGLAIAHLQEERTSTLRTELVKQQKLLFALGAQLADSHKTSDKQVIEQQNIVELEKSMDYMEGVVGPNA